MQKCEHASRRGWSVGVLRRWAASQRSGLVAAGVVLVVLALAATVRPAPLCQGTCEFAFLDESWGDTTWTAPPECVVCAVRVRAEQMVVLMSSNGCLDGYCVEGINRQTGRVWRECELGPDCPEIWTVAWWNMCPPSPLPTPTVESPLPTPTPPSAATISRLSARGGGALVISIAGLCLAGLLAYAIGKKLSIKSTEEENSDGAEMGVP
jgi:hypothetical protein